MAPFTDMAGMKFGRLTALHPVERRPRVKWECICECGNTVTVLAHKLRSGWTKSCGCLKAEVQVRANSKHGYASLGRRSRLHSIWTNMRTRCFNPKGTDYPRYGGRGITVCAEWLDFVAFKDWALATGYTDNLTIDREDSNGNYDPSNCRWATKTQQAQENNRKIRAVIRNDGEYFPRIEAASAASGVTASTISRIVNGRSSGRRSPYQFRYATAEEIADRKRASKS